MSAWVHLLRAHSEITTAFNRDLLAGHALTINDYEVLLLLSHADERRLRRIDIAERMRLSPSGVTRLLDGLEESGYVEKQACSADGRVSYAVLTDEGLACLEKASESHLRAVAELFDERYSEQELRTLNELLGRLPGAGGVDPDACGPPAG